MGKYIVLFEISYFAFLTPPTEHTLKFDTDAFLMENDRYT